MQSMLSATTVPVSERVWGFLAHAHDGLQIHRAPEWERVLALGVLGGQASRSPLSIHVLLVGRFRRSYRHLVRASYALTHAYEVTAILPDLHLMSRSWFDALECEGGDPWARATSTSVELLRD